MTGSVVPVLVSGKWAQDLSSETGGVVSNVITQAFALGATIPPSLGMAVIAALHVEATGSFAASDVVATYGGLPCQVAVVKASIFSDQRCLVVVQCVPGLAASFSGDNFVLTIGGAPGTLFYFKGWAGVATGVDSATTLADLVFSNSGATLSPYSQTIGAVTSAAGGLLISSMIVDDGATAPVVQSPTMIETNAITTVDWAAAARLCPGPETNPVTWGSAGSLGQQSAYGFSTQFRPLACDPAYGSVTALLPFDDGNGSSSFTDLTGMTTWAGNTTETTAQAMFGIGSLDLTGATDFIKSPEVANGPFDLSESQADFTVEFWVYPLSAPSTSRLMCDLSAFGQTLFGLYYSGSMIVTGYPFGSWATLTNSIGALNLNAWNHVAAVRHGSEFTVYTNGIGIANSEAITIPIPAIGASNFAYLGQSPIFGGDGPDQYIDEVRITKGVARYTTDFIPPAQAFGQSCNILVPNVIGDTLGTATSAITGAGLVLGNVSNLFNSSVPVGIVFQQSPGGGTSVSGGSPVNVTLSLGAQFATVPDVLEMTAADARSAITGAGLITGAISGVVDPTTPIGSVATQSPIGGIQVPFGSAVNLGISFLVSEFDVDITVISQYANSPTILAMVEDFGQWFDPAANIQDFYLTVWNIETATGFGLDIWGIILGVSRVIPIPGTSGAFGFDNADTPKDWQTFGNLNDPAAGGPFFSGQISTGSYRLTDGPYLTLLLTKALANVCATTAPALNALITNLFPGRGRCYTQDLGGMMMAYHFNFALTTIELAILEFSGVLAHPAGVGVTINIVPESLFGFEEAGALSKPFNFGVFYNGS